MTNSQKDAESNETVKLSRLPSKWYTTAAIIVLNTLILFFSFTLLSYAYYAIRGDRGAVVYSAWFRPRAMHRMSNDQAIQFFREFDRLGENETYKYQPWVAFSERVVHLPRLNVDEATPLPIRRTTHNSSAPVGAPLVIWTFGGSTMFGFGVPDDETIASHLSAILSRALPSRSVTVINHGHVHYFSSQELALFQMLLRRGDRSDFAIFLDGVNDSFYDSDVPYFTDRMVLAMEKEQRSNPTAQTNIRVSPDFPPLKLLRAFGRRLARQPLSRPYQFPTSDPVGRYRFNLSVEGALGSMHGIKPLFFWQPADDRVQTSPVREVTAKVRNSVHTEGFHFIGDIFDDRDPADVYIDDFHYGDTANERIAEVIAEEVLARINKN
jgi:hypothetical protein